MRALRVAMLAATLLSGGIASAHVCAIAPAVDDTDAAPRQGLDVGSSSNDRPVLVHARAGELGAGVRSGASGSIGPAALSSLSLDLRAHQVRALVDDARSARPYRAPSHQRGARAPPISL